MSAGERIVPRTASMPSLSLRVKTTRESAITSTLTGEEEALACDVPDKSFNESDEGVVLRLLDRWGVSG